MQPFDCDLFHFVGNRVVPVSGQAIDAGPNQEMRSDLLCRTEQFVYVALSVTDVDASPRIAQCRRGLPDVFQPPDALLLLDRNARWIDLLLERVGPLEFLPGPEFDCRQTKRQTFARYRQARMHQDSADRVDSRTSALCPTVVHLVCDSDRLHSFPLKRKLRRIVHHQHRTITRCKAVMGRLKMTGQDVPLVHTFVGEKPIRRLGVRPVLTHHRDPFAHCAPDLLKQVAEPFAEPSILELAPRDLTLNPPGRTGNAAVHPMAIFSCGHGAPSESIQVLERNHNRFIRFKN